MPRTLVVCVSVFLVVAQAEALAAPRPTIVQRSVRSLRQGAKRLDALAKRAPEKAGLIGASLVAAGLTVAAHQAGLQPTVVKTGLAVAASTLAWGVLPGRSVKWRPFAATLSAGAIMGVGYAHLIAKTAVDGLIQAFTLGGLL